MTKIYDWVDQKLDRYLDDREIADQKKSSVLEKLNTIPLIKKLRKQAEKWACQKLQKFQVERLLRQLRLDTRELPKLEAENSVATKKLVKDKIPYSVLVYQKAEQNNDFCYDLDTDFDLTTASETTIGDMHGSFLKLIESSVLAGMIDLPVEYLQKLYTILDERFDDVGDDNYTLTDPRKIKQTIAIINQIQWTGESRKLRMMGDILADRDGNDLVMLHLIQRLKNLSKSDDHDSISYLVGNHDIEGIIQPEKHDNIGYLQMISKRNARFVCDLDTRLKAVYRQLLGGFVDDSKIVEVTLDKNGELDGFFNHAILADQNFEEMIGFLYPRLKNIRIDTRFWKNFEEDMNTSYIQLVNKINSSGFESLDDRELQFWQLLTQLQITQSEKKQDYKVNTSWLSARSQVYPQYLSKFRTWITGHHTFDGEAFGLPSTNHLTLNNKARMKTTSRKENTTSKFFVKM
jgi:hypothetical protein